MNNLGGLSELEMHIIGRKVVQYLGEFAHIVRTTNYTRFWLSVLGLTNFAQAGKIVSIAAQIFRQVDVIISFTDIIQTNPKTTIYFTK